MLSDDVIQKIKEENDIVDVISESVRLKRTGRNFSGLCPFHHEKTPSFSVSQDKQIFKCFGCGEAGNVITFVMKTKNLSFIEAVTILAERAHIEISTDSSSAAQMHKNDKLYNINVEAARFFFSNLKTKATAKQYFLGRGITEATIRRFGLGYSLDNWNALMTHLRGKGYSELDLLDAGLILKSPKGTYYDRFRNRVMFPVFDFRGKIIGFGGRVLDDSKPKYLNSPETAVFKKGTNLYGLNFAIKSNTNRTIIIVEGYMDCISLHQFGITNVVASLGTALTPSQAKLLKRHADKIIISYDADTAGQTATLRGLDILRAEAFDVRVLTVPQGKDPDEYVRNNGKEAFVKLIEEALPLVDYKLSRLREGVDFSSSEQIANFAKNAANMLADLNPVEKDVYIKKISEETRIKEQAIYDLISGEIQKNVNKSEDMNIADNFGQKLYVEPAYIKAERSLLRLMISDRQALDYITQNISMDDFILNSHKKIYKLIIDNMDEEDTVKLQRIEVKCDDIESAREWTNVLDIKIMYQDDAYIKLIEDYTKEIKKFKLEESKRAIMSRIKECESMGLLEESLKLMQELMNIQKDLGRL